MAYRLNENGVPREMQIIVLLQQHIDQQQPGVFTLKELFAEYWPHFKRQRYYGRWFKRAVELGYLEGIDIYRKRSDRSWEYVIL